MLRCTAVCGDSLIFRSLLAMHCRNIGIAKLCRRLGERVEHRLQVESRTANNLEYIGSRGLLLQRLPQFIEQPRILDGDDSLGGEVLDQRDLLVREWPDFLTVNAEHSYRLVLLEHRHN